MNFVISVWIYLKWEKNHCFLRRKEKENAISVQKHQRCFLHCNTFFFGLFQNLALILHYFSTDISFFFLFVFYRCIYHVLIFRSDAFIKSIYSYSSWIYLYEFQCEKPPQQLLIDTNNSIYFKSGFFKQSLLA